MNTLTEKDLKYYLGTGLKVHVDEYGFELVIGIQGDELITTEDNATIDICKPLMLPLSALTEQLPDRSIPIVELAKISFPNQKWYMGGNTVAESNNGYWFWYNTESFGFSVDGTIQNYVPNQLQLFEYLYANHFWLGDQSLFETGEIIDKRTVKTD